MSKLKITAGIKKVLRILLFCATGVVLLAGMLYLLLQTSYVQTALVQYITQQVKASTGVTIQIGHVDFRPVKSLVLKEVLLKDFIILPGFAGKGRFFQYRKQEFHDR